MKGRTSKSRVDLFLYYQPFAHPNKTSIKYLIKITSSIIITLSCSLFLFCSVCLKAKMTKQPHWKPCSYSTSIGFLLHANDGVGRDTYSIFLYFQYFILFVCEAIKYVWVRFLKKKSKALSVFQNLLTLLEQQFRIWVSIFYTDLKKFNSEAAAIYFEESGIIWDSFVPYTQ